MDLGLRGRVALVTASSKGLGFATARALVEEGARVAINGHDPDNLARARDELGGDVLALGGDVTDAAVPARLVADTVAHFGGLHVLVGNAPGPPPARALDVDDDGIRKAVE